jgi:hypothetical protein
MNPPPDRHDPNRDKPDGEPPVYAPYLYIRYDVADTGDRQPNGSLPAGTTFWESPDVTFAPADALGNADVGSKVTITGRVFNGGLADAIATFVEFWVFDPSLTFTATTGTQIGTKLVTVPAGNYVDVVCPKTWVPKLFNGGHECLVVQCSTPEEGSNGLQFPFSPALDRHCGQHNISVVELTAPMGLQLVIANLSRRPEVSVLYDDTFAVHADWHALHALSLAELTPLVAAARANPLVHDPSGKPIELTVKSVDGSLIQIREIERASIGRHEPTETPDGQGAGATPAGRAIGEFELPAATRATLEFRAEPTNAGRDEIVVRRITQAVGDRAVGGYTVIALPPGFKL